MYCSGYDNKGRDLCENQNDSEEDDFEAEMLKELNDSLKQKSLQMAAGNVDNYANYFIIFLSFAMK